MPISWWILLEISSAWRLLSKPHKILQDSFITFYRWESRVSGFTGRTFWDGKKHAFDCHVLSAILIYDSLFVCHTCCLLYDDQWFKVIGKPCKYFLLFHSLFLMHGTLSLKKTCHNIIQKGKQRPHTEGQAPSSQTQDFFFLLLLAEIPVYFSN